MYVATYGRTESRILGMHTHILACRDEKEKKLSQISRIINRRI